MIQSLRISRDDWKEKNAERRIETKRQRELIRNLQAKNRAIKLECKRHAKETQIKEQAMEQLNCELEKQKVQNAELAKALEEAKKKLLNKS